MFWRKFKQFLCTRNQNSQSKGENTLTEGEELVGETETASGVTSSETKASVGVNADSREATKDKNKAIGLNQAVSDITEDKTQEENFGAKTEKPNEENSSWVEAILRHHEFLVEWIFTEFGLVDKLCINDSFSYIEMEKINVSKAFYKRNRKLLDIVIKRNKQHELVEALKESGQSHLVNYLKTDGKYRAEFCGDWPLNNHEIKILRENRENLIDLLNICDLLSRLYSTGVINRRQREFIYWKAAPYEKNEAFVDILRRSSLKAYRQTIRCLPLDNQGHIAKILEKGEVLVRADASLQGEEKAMNHVEEQIAAEITNLLGNTDLPESSSSRIWELVQLNLIAARQGHSVALYFLCYELRDVDRLQQMTKDGRLKETIETVFNRLIKTSAKIRVRLKRITPDFKHCIQYFKDIMKQPKNDKTIKDIQNPTMSDLQFELLDSILLKSYLQHFILKDKQLLKNKDRFFISQIASVDFCWFQRITKRKFKKQVLRNLAVFYRRKENLSSVYRINRQYLEENARLKGLVNRLKSNDFLTDVQTASLYRHHFELGKKNSFKRFRDLISEVVKKREVIHSVFRRYLCDTKQNLIREVIEIGGAVVEVKIKFQKAKTSAKTGHQNLQLLARINEIRNKTKARSRHIEELMGKLKQGYLEIFNAGHDGDVVVVWIWCKAKKALEQLQTLNESKHLMDTFTELVKNLLFPTEDRNPAMIKPKVSIDFEQFERTIAEKPIAFFSIAANFTSRFELRRAGEDKEELEGLTKLRNKIYVLLYRYLISPCVILVFEDQIPFRLQKRIEIQEIKQSTDIVSIEMENSLYVLDRWRNYVWKIKEGDEIETKEKSIRWLGLADYRPMADTLSVTRDGQLLMVGKKYSDPLWSLNFFGGSEEAEFRLSILLPEDIKPHHAVETSKGNFIILHMIPKITMEDGSDEGGTHMAVVSEVSGDGKTILRRFIPKNKEQKLDGMGYLAVDSLDRVFFANIWKDNVILLGSELEWKGILVPRAKWKTEECRIRTPRVFYDERKKELIVGGRYGVLVYTLIR